MRLDVGFAGGGCYCIGCVVSLWLMLLFDVCGLVGGGGLVVDLGDLVDLRMVLAFVWYTICGGVILACYDLWFIMWYIADFA